MNKVKVLIFSMILIIISLSAFAQVSIRQFPTMNGSTGAFVVPTANVNYEVGTVGIDGGYKFIWTEGGNMSHILYTEVGFLKQAEVGFAVQIDPYGWGGLTTDFMANIKWQFSELFKQKGASDMALGMNFSAVDVYNGNNNYNFYGQFYYSISYAGMLFSSPAKTSIMVGYTFKENMNSNIDAGIAFQVNVFPKVFKDYVNFVMDFANFSYIGSNPTGFNTNRGIMNAGLRFSFLNGAKYSRYLLGLDIIGTDLLDAGTRGVAVAISGGSLLK